MGTCFMNTPFVALFSWEKNETRFVSTRFVRSESTLDRILIHRGVLAEKLFFSGDPRLFLESSIYKVSRTLKPKQIYILWQMYCVVKKYFKAIFKDFPFCHTAIITTLQGWVDLAAMLEKLQMDRVALLLDGEPWKEKNLLCKPETKLALH